MRCNAKVRARRANAELTMLCLRFAWSNFLAHREFASQTPEFFSGLRNLEREVHIAKILKLGAKFGRKRGRLLLPATCLVLLLAAGVAVWPQAPAPAFNITLAGQSMIRSDFRVHTPAELATISPLLTGDVIFTNFEATVVEKGQSLHDGRFLSPPEALDALKALGFNLLALSDNHSFDLKVSGVQNTLREVKSRNIAHAGIGNNVEEAAAPGYLHTPKGTVALVAMASGLIAEGGSATATRPGVNELRPTPRTSSAFCKASAMPASMPTW
jgi:hypothetical protein